MNPDNLIKIYFSLPDKFESGELITKGEKIEIEVPFTATIDEIKIELQKKLYRESEQMPSLAFVEGHVLSAKEVIQRAQRFKAIYPVDVMFINKSQESKEEENDISLKDHFRVWFSNNPECFLPPLEKIIIEESVALNPQCNTSLIVDKEILNEREQAQLMNWSQKKSCSIIDLADIHPTSEIDAIILAIVKRELKEWKLPVRAGNPGLATDLVRLLYVDKGIYFDCDVFTYAGIPENLNCEQGWFSNFMFLVPISVLNNDILTFSSTKGKNALHELKKFILTNYFKEIGEIPNAENLAESLNHIMENRTKHLQTLNKEERITFFDGLVAGVTGPWALRDCLNSDTKANQYNEILEYLNYTRRNVNGSFLATINSNERAGCSWHDGRSNLNDMAQHAQSFRDYLRQDNAAHILRRDEVPEKSSSFSPEN